MRGGSEGQGGCALSLPHVHGHRLQLGCCGARWTTLLAGERTADQFEEPVKDLAVSANAPATHSPGFGVLDSFLGADLEL